MSKMKIDLSQFTHVSSDDKTTTLEHKLGHRMILAHSALPKEYKVQFEALSKASKKESNNEEPKKMADGGDVDTSLPEQFGTDKPAPVMSEMPKQEQVAAMPQPAEQPQITPQAARFNELKLQFPNQPDEAIVHTIEVEGRQKAVQDVQQQKVQSQVDAASAESKQHLQEISLQKQQMGIPLSKLEQDSLAPADVSQAEQPKTLASAPTDQAAPTEITPPKAQTSGYDQQIAGVNAEAKAQEALAKEKQQVYEDAIRVKSAAETQYKQDIDQANEDSRRLVQDIQKGYVSPDKFWTGTYNPVTKQTEGGHSKIAAAIGIIIAGFNPTNQPNAAINFLNHQMDMNLQAQQKNLDASNGLLKANYEKLGDIRQAYSLSQAQQRYVVADQLELAASKTANQFAKAQALQQAGKIRVDADAKTQEFAKQRTVAQLTSLAKDPKQMNAAIDALSVYDPKTADQLRQRSVPGLGLANTDEGAKGVRAMQTTYKTVTEGLNRLEAISKKTGKSISPALRSEADTIRQSMIGQLREPITGPGSMSDTDRKMLEGLIPDVTAIFSYDANTRTRLKTLNKRMEDGYKNMAVANGLSIPGQQAGTTAPTQEGIVRGKDGKNYRREGKYMVPVK